MPPIPDETDRTTMPSEIIKKPLHSDQLDLLFALSNKAVKDLECGEVECNVPVEEPVEQVVDDGFPVNESVYNVEASNALQGESDAQNELFMYQLFSRKDDATRAAFYLEKVEIRKLEKMRELLSEMNHVPLRNVNLPDEKISSDEISTRILKMERAMYEARCSSGSSYSGSTLDEEDICYYENF